MNEQNPYRRRKGRFLFAPLAPLLFFGITAIVMLLWNAVLPDLLQVKRISYWQSAGLLLLCRILFGGFGFRGPGGRFSGGDRQAKWQSKLQNMSDEERAEFKNRWRQRCEQWKRNKE
jgi:hypothetical protein